MFRCGEQIELSFQSQREDIESGIDRIIGYVAHKLEKLQSTLL